MNTKEQWENKADDFYNKIFSDGYEAITGIGSVKTHEKNYDDYIDFIRETREQAYQKGLDDGYDEGFRACEKGVTP